MTVGGLLKQAIAWAAPQVLLYRTRGEGVAVTFDDGPHPKQTPLLLDALRRLNVRATFFLQGDHASQWPELVRRTHAQGHQIANHAWSHTSAKKMAVRDFVDEVERTQALLESITGAPLKRDVRPPFGDITPGAFWALARRGYRFVYWSVDSDDSTHREPTVLCKHMAGLAVRHGDIVLFHEDYEHTAAAMPDIVNGLRAQGVPLRPIDS